MRQLDEARAVWLLVLADAIAIWVTYARLPATELYNVTGTAGPTASSTAGSASSDATSPSICRPP